MKAVLIGLAVLLVSAGAASAAARDLPTKETEVNDITVEASPRRVDDRGAVIAVVLDTHSGDLDVDLRKRTTLTVGGETWPTVGYRGDGPEGHHREGTLRFESAGPAAGAMRLVIKGLGEPVKLSWRLESS